MDAVECILSRKSIRSFNKEPVPQALLKEVIDCALRSPSYKNSQPWEVIVLSGNRKEALSRVMVDLLEKGVPPRPDIPSPKEWPPAEQSRIDLLYRKRAEATGIDLANPGIIRKAKEANFNFYRAPHAIYLYQDSSLTPWSLFDLGIFAQSLMLAAHARGLGTVPQAFPTDYAAEIKQFLEIPESKRLVLCLSIGYPNADSPANKMTTGRGEIDDFVRWEV